MKRPGIFAIIVFLLLLPVFANGRPVPARSLGLTPRGPAAAPAEPLPAPEFQADTRVVRAYFHDRQMVAELAVWTEPWEVDYGKGYAIVAVNMLQYGWLLDRGFRVEVDDALTARLRQPNLPLPHQVSGIPGYPCYRTVEETFATAQDIVADYPQLATWIDAGDSWEKVTPGGSPGYDLMVLRLTNTAVPGPKPKLFVMSSVHAREYTPAELNTRFAEHLVQNYGVDPDVTWLLDYHEFHLLLQANPDGRKQAETGLSWRKNTSEDYCSPTSNYRGADLNRNFSFQWGCCGGSSGSQCDLTYRGPSPASEPEVQAIQNYVRAEFPDLRADPLTSPAPVTATGVFLDLHSYSELVLWPWGFTSSVAPNGPALQTLGRKLAYFNSYHPEQAIGLYPTDGTTDDFAYGELGLAAYTFELGTSFFQSCSTFENSILPDNLPALLLAAKAARAPYRLPTGPDLTQVSLAATAVTAGTAVSLTATVDDTRFNNANGSEPTQAIAAAVYTVDIPYWITVTTPISLPLAAGDGAFDETVETAVATVDTSGWSAGRHILYVRGQDQAGNWGAVTAVFLNIIDPAVAPVIEGSVLQAGSNEPLTATVTTSGSLFQSTTDPSGFYQMYVVSDTYDLVATAAGHLAQTVPGVQAFNQQTIRQNFVLTPTCTILANDVEGGTAGWTADLPWAISTANAHSPTHAWTDSPGGNYGNNRNVSLYSPILDLSGVSGLTLHFWQICDTESGYDYCIVEASPNGGSSWTEVARYDGLGPAWNEQTIALSLLDNQANGRIRFRLDTDYSVTDDGWSLDDIWLSGTGPACVPAPVTVTARAQGSDLVLEWNHLAVNGSYDVHSSTLPYFATGGLAPVASLPAPAATFTDTAALGNPAANTFYLIRARLAVSGLGANSNRVGEFSFVIKPGTP